MMRWIIRADSGVQLGNGHVMRCLVLAEALRARGHNVLFVLRDLPGNLSDHIKAKGFPCELLGQLPASQEVDAEYTHKAATKTWGQEADGVVVDQYDFDRRWHAYFFSRDYRILVIDDLADRPLLAHWVLDQTLGRAEQDYTPRISSHCQLLLGTRFCLLRPEFRLKPADVLDLRRRLIAEKNQQRGWKILVSLGGTDPDNHAGAVLETLRKFTSVERITLVMGWHAPHLPTMQTLALQDNRVEVLVGVDNMAELLLMHDLAIGAGGTSAWERCAVGLPCITLQLADNQRQVVANLKQAGAIQYLPDAADVAAMAACLSRFEDSDFYLEHVERCLAVCDGQGTERIVEIITAENLPLSNSHLERFH